MLGSLMLYFAEYFSGLFAKSSKFYQEQPAIQTASARVFPRYSAFRPSSSPFRPPPAAVFVSAHGMLKIYNTLAREKQDFLPITPGKVRMYVCGMTVYDYCHLGHARMMVVFDVVQRWLRASGYDVTYVRNITDIDDKIIRRAQENKEPIEALTARFIAAM